MYFHFIFFLKIPNKHRQPSFGPFSTELTTSAGILKDPFDSEWASMAGSGNNGLSNVEADGDVAVSTNPFSGDGFEDEDEVDKDAHHQVHV